MTTFIFGDVHGDRDRLARLLDQAYEASPGAVEVYSVGDLVDRGRDSKGVIDLCIEHGVKPILGNHELWLRHLLVDGEFNPFAASEIMGGVATLESYGLNEYADPLVMREVIPDLHREYLAFAPFYRNLEVGGRTYRLTHGGFHQRFASILWETINEGGHREGRTDAEACDILVAVTAKQYAENILWGGAKRGNVFRFPDGSVQVFGHTPWRGGAEINDAGGYIALDTGCGTCPPYRLSGVLLTDDGDRQILSA